MKPDENVGSVGNMKNFICKEEKQDGAKQPKQKEEVWDDEGMFLC